LEEINSDGDFQSVDGDADDRASEGILDAESGAAATMWNKAAP